MPASPITALTDRRVFQGIVDKRIKPYTALKTLLFPKSVVRLLHEDTAQLDVLTGGYGMAPFVKVGQRAILMDSLSGTGYTVSTPFINIKRALKWGNRLAARMAGQVVFSQGGEQLMAAVQEALTADADMLNTLIDNREEWMVAMLLQNALTYTAEGFDSFTVDTGKPAANDFTVGVLWTVTDGTAVPLTDIRLVKKLMGTYRGPMPDIAICGANAGAALHTLIEKDLIPSIRTTSGVIAGGGDLRTQLEADGMMYICRLGNVDFYEYVGTYTHDVTGSETPLIRPDYVEFFSTGSKSVQMRDLYYGRIPDIGVIMAGQSMTQRHGIVVPPKPDQGTLEGIIKSRPLPWFRRSDWQCSMEVV